MSEQTISSTEPEPEYQSLIPQWKNLSFLERFEYFLDFAVGIALIRSSVASRAFRR